MKEYLRAGVDNLFAEAWRQIFSHDDRYWVSNFGRVKSEFHDSRGMPVAHLMATHINHGGYWIVAFPAKVSGDHGKRLVHRLVAEAFIPRRIGVTQVNHKNGLKWDCHVGNLEWMTQKENIRHSIDVLGNAPKRSLTFERAVFVKAAIAKGASCNSIARIVGVHSSAILRLKAGENYSHVRQPTQAEIDSINLSDFFRPNTGRPRGGRLLSNEAASDIKKSIANKSMTRRELSRKYKVCPSLVSRIANGKLYKNVA